MTPAVTGRAHGASPTPHVAESQGHTARNGTTLDETEACAQGHGRRRVGLR